MYQDEFCNVRLFDTLFFQDDSTDYYDDEGNVKRPQKLRLDDLGVRDSVSLEPGRRCVSTKTFDQINRRPSGVSPLARAANDLVTAKAGLSCRCHCW